MELVNKYSYSTISRKLLGNKVHFTSDCELFPNFDVTGKVIEVYMLNGELLFRFLTKNGKKITIGSNMSNLKFELI